MASLTEILILHGLLPIEKLDTLMAGDPADESAVRALVDSGVITEAQFARARAEQAGLAFVELIDFPVDRLAVALVTPAMSRRHQVLPIAIEGGRLVLAMVDPGNVFAIDDVRESARMRVIPVVAEKNDLLAAIARYHRADDELSNLTTTMEDEQATVEAASAFGVSDSLDDDAPIVRFVNLLVSQAIQDKASDIHIEPAEHNLRVRYRIDGVLHEMQRAPKSIQNGVISRLKIMSDIDIAERRKPQDGRMSVSHAGRQIDLRVATLPTVWGEKIVMRILDNSSTTMDLHDLNLLEHNYEAYRKSYTKPYGMILVTGPTGSGKSTTLYTTLNSVARPEINVITVEDPVEYRMKDINQVQVNPKAGLTFASALRSILRSDPDVVLLGEIRDHETAQIAIEASLTGHLVLSTLHTNDAPSAITRLTEMGIEPFLVGSALDCVVAQRLARRLCDRCKAPAEVTVERLNQLRFGFDPTQPLPVLYQPIGCQNCSKTGYRGRLAVHEVMTVSENIERLAVDRASSADIGRAARSEGMISLRDDGWEKVRMGLTSIEEILRVVA
ncbi:MULTISPECIES: GspE/PulE family protein [Cryobacterium]|uniref:Type II secretion system protein GspE n=3 Tax=Bacteria TaxID=2 RepID=A0ABY2IMC4_9MICO|nr:MULTISPECIES: ATPase, T2SS/T4P/T4SS family [Cryobacterium]MDY7529134.1 ATPase, T2SS/T4P/T4SS family [Cryobacterium sp. 10C2]MDY7558704.1 ATPase, T2SS/T4P/T4SS family [Cryobacterium sp. 10C3]MEB0002156.1 ATPase, T2SS/T4P/T4SS family [Cryobacterium sp. RTC2.1]MEB0201910.1 ATPase, T2SS/T4P/T4SS family [Cryobacterium sp. 5I3]MEB0287011.1 ATPase, T2SS/T4P/T4SS family [Cryobacterium sp. 10S3]